MKQLFKCDTDSDRESAISKINAANPDKTIYISSKFSKGKERGEGVWFVAWAFNYLESEKIAKAGALTHQYSINGCKLPDGYSKDDMRRMQSVAAYHLADQ